MYIMYSKKNKNKKKIFNSIQIIFKLPNASQHLSSTAIATDVIV